MVFSIYADFDDVSWAYSGVFQDVIDVIEYYTLVNTKWILKSGLKAILQSGWKYIETLLKSL